MCLLPVYKEEFPCWFTHLKNKQVWLHVKRHCWGRSGAEPQWFTLHNLAEMIKCLPPSLLLHSSSNSGHVLKGWLRSRGTTPVVKISFLILHLWEQLANMLCCFSLLKTGESIQTCRTQNITVFFQRSGVVKEAETITRIPAGVSIWIYRPVSLKGTQLFFPSLETNVV